MKLPSKPNDSTLRMACPISRSLHAMQLDPARVNTITQANLVRNLYSRLVEYTPDGNLVPSAAKFFEWNNGSVHFEMRSDLQTVDGTPVTAQDAANSFKRLLIKDSNTHGDLQNFLCPDAVIKSLNDDCPGIRVEGNVLVLTPADEAKRAFLVPLLASSDFSIIPQHSIDKSNPDLPIVDYRNTSGAYYLSKDAVDGSHELKVNLHHFHYSEAIPQTIQFVPAYGDKAVERFKNNELDFIPTFAFMKLDELNHLAQTVHDVSTHQTLNIAMRAVTFTRRGQNELSADQRLYLGREIRKRFNEFFHQEGVTATHEFFPVFGEGSLNPNQKLRLQKLFDDLAQPLFSAPVSFAIPTGELDIYQKAFGAIAPIQFIESERAPWTLPESEQPDFYISFIDTAFFEDISLISYNIDHGTFGFDRIRGKTWLNDYMATADKNQRLAKLRALHFEFLSAGRIIPIVNLPYIAIARAPWRTQYSRYYSASPFWLIKKQ